MKVLRFLNKETKAKQAYVFYFCLATVFVFPIIFANVYFADDMARKVIGNYGWLSIGRPLANFLMQLLTFSSNKISDVGQLFQLTSIPMLAFGVYFWVKSLYRKPTIYQLLMWSPLIVNPYLLSNISFRYDSLFMVSAYVLSIIGASLDLSGWRNKLICASLLMVTLCCYQPMASVFIGLSLILLCYRVIINSSYRAIFNKFLFQLTIYFIANVVYYLGLILIGGGGSKRGSLVTGDLLRYSLRNYKALYKYIEQFFIGSGYWVFILLAIVFLFSYCLTVIMRSISKPDSEREKKYKVLCLSILLISPLILFVNLLGPFVLLKDVVIDWRTLPSFVCVLLLFTVFGYGLYLYTSKYKLVQLILPGLTTILVVYLIVFSFVFGSYLKNSSDYINFVAGRLTSSLADKRMLDERITISGLVGRPQSSKIITRNFPSINQVLPSGGYWGQRYILTDMGVAVRVDMQHEYPNMEKNICENRLTPVVTTPWYEIYPSIKNQGVLVFLTNNNKDRLCS